MWKFHFRSRKTSCADTTVAVKDIDLSLVSVKDMLDEISKRCISFIYAYRIRGDKDDQDVIVCDRGSGRWDASCSLSNILNNHILNNWNDELTKLSKIIEREEDDKD